MGGRSGSRGRSGSTCTIGSRNRSRSGSGSGSCGRFNLKRSGVSRIGKIHLGVVSIASLGSRIDSGTLM